MILAFKLLAIACCGLICYQDFRERLVYWFLFPMLGIALAYIFFQYTVPTFFLWSVVTNCVLVTLILGLLYLYSKYRLQKPLVNHSLGLGDILFFYALAVGYPPVTFLVLFVGAVFFSLFSYLVLKKSLRNHTVPLAGLMGFYVMIIVSCSFFVSPNMLYTT